MNFEPSFLMSYTYICMPLSSSPGITTSYLCHGARGGGVQDVIMTLICLEASPKTCITCNEPFHLPFRESFVNNNDAQTVRSFLKASRKVHPALQYTKTNSARSTNSCLLSSVWGSSLRPTSACWDNRCSWMLGGVQPHLKISISTGKVIRL